MSPRNELEPLFLEHVAAYQPQVANVFLHQVRDVVIANEQHIERHVLAETHELIATARQLEAATLEQLERRVGEPAGFLYRELEALVFVDGCHD
jgi:hypothetical protein